MQAPACMLKIFKHEKCPFSEITIWGLLCGLVLLRSSSLAVGCLGTMAFLSTEKNTLVVPNMMILTMMLNGWWVRWWIGLLQRRWWWMMLMVHD